MYIFIFFVGISGTVVFRMQSTTCEQGVFAFRSLRRLLYTITDTKDSTLLLHLVK
jgi:hypothetical protein